MLESARAHRERTWRNLFADVLAAEQADGSRVVTRGTHWTAFVPAAARWPMEVHLYPNRQVADLPGLTDEERDEFAEIYLDVLHRLDALYDSPMPYIAAWHQAPVRIDRDLAYLHLEVFSIRRAAGQAQVPGRQRVGHGCLHQRRDAGAGGGAAARRGSLGMTIAMTVSDAFTATYDDAPAGVWSAPGRVNLIGEHTDYNDGFVLPFAIEARTFVAARVRGDGVLRMRSVQKHTGDVSIDLADIEPGKPDGWAAYVAGVVWAAREAGHQVRGMDLLVDGRVPLGSGLSSSHALECAIALAMNDMFELGLDANSLGRLSYTAENDFVGAPTGMMDQLASLRCTAGNALFLDNRTLEAEQVPLDAEAAGLRLLAIDTRVRHGNADGAYGNRRAACEKAADLLGVDALRDIDVAGLHDALDRLGDDELAAAPATSCSRTRGSSTPSTRSGAADWPRVGALMTASHASLRDDYEVSCDELDTAVETAAACGALGARMTGGGFGGCAIALVPADATAALARRGHGRVPQPRLDRPPGLRGHPLRRRPPRLLTRPHLPRK